MYLHSMRMRLNEVDVRKSGISSRRLTAIAFLMVSFQTGSFSKTYSGVEYSRPNGQSLVFDARVPDGAGPFPIAILVHGGAWVTGDRKHSVQPLFEPILNSGVACFSISYRLAQFGKADSLPSALASAAVVSNAVEDVRQATAYIRAHAAEYNVDPARIVLIGESAGAQLASMAALKLDGMAPVQGVVAFYSPSDLAALLTQDPADRLDRVPLGALLVDEGDDQRLPGSSSPTKKDVAAFKIDTSSRSLRFSALRRLISSFSSLLTPGRSPRSTSAWRTQRRTLS